MKLKTKFKFKFRANKAKADKDAVELHAALLELSSAILELSTQMGAMARSARNVSVAYDKLVCLQYEKVSGRPELITVRNLKDFDKVFGERRNYYDET